MPKVELTDRFLRSAKPAAGSRQTEYFDAIVKGLSSMASTGGARTFYLHYTRRADNRRARIKLGTYPEMTLAKARETARSVRGKIGEGNDPAADKRAQAASLTVRDLVENYVARHASTKRSGDAIARRLRRNVSDLIGDVKLSELHRRDLTRCIDAVKDRGSPIAANRVFSGIRTMIRWAHARGDLDQNLTESMRRPTETEVQRDRVLSTNEIVIVWAELPKADMWEATRRILLLCLITGQRVGEVAGIRRDELNLEACLWTIPSTRTKNGQEHRVPLSNMAAGIIIDQIAAVDALDRRKEREPSAWIFPGPGGWAPITGPAIAKAVKRQEKGGTILGVASWTPHDLRRTVATHMEEFGISPFVVGHVLNHVSAVRSTITSQVYARYDYAREKREALNQWAVRLEALVGGERDKVVPLHHAVAS